jgi:hypothetical protein
MGVTFEYLIIQFVYKFFMKKYKKIHNVTQFKKYLLKIPMWNLHKQKSFYKEFKKFNKKSDSPILDLENALQSSVISKINFQYDNKSIKIKTCSLIEFLYKFTKHIGQYIFNNVSILYGSGSIIYYEFSETLNNTINTYVSLDNILDNISEKCSVYDYSFEREKPKSLNLNRTPTEIPHLNKIILTDYNYQDNLNIIDNDLKLINLT